MKQKLFLAAALCALALSPAVAADVPQRIGSSAIGSPDYDWRGFYAGVVGGFDRGHVDVRDTNGGVNPGPFNYDPEGGNFSGLAGLNWQTGRWVYGVEAELGYMGFEGKGRIGSSNAAAHQDLTLDGGLFASVTGRVGYAYGPALFYAKGGFAWLDGEAKQATTNPGYQPRGTGSFSGWTVGGGVEYRLMTNVNLRAEYDHYDFGSEDGFQKNVGDPSSPIGYKFRNTHDLAVDAVKGGVVLRF